MYNIMVWINETALAEGVYKETLLDVDDLPGESCICLDGDGDNLCDENTLSGIHYIFGGSSKASQYYSVVVLYRDGDRLRTSVLQYGLPTTQDSVELGCSVSYQAYLDGR